MGAFTSLLHQSATIQRPVVASYDAYGNPTTTTTTLGPYPCRLQERQGGEDYEGRQSIDRVAVVFFNPDVAVQYTDRIAIGGDTWEVRGEPVVYHDAVGPHHIEVAVQRFEL